MPAAVLEWRAITTSGIWAGGTGNRGQTGRFLQDAANSARSGVSGASYETCTSLPFGDWLNCSTSDPSPMHFTGKEHDAETGLDNFGARYDSSSLGRFLTPDWSSDPEAVPYAKLGNPQSLNLYAYVQNNPVNALDLDGHSYAMFDTPNSSGGGDLPEMTESTNGHGEQFIVTFVTTTVTVVNTVYAPTPQQAAGAEKENTPRPRMLLSPGGLDFIKQHEGFRSKVYKDSAGNPTIGYGHLIKPGEKSDKGITQEAATALLAEDVGAAVDAVNNGLEVKVSQTQFDALVDFTFNLGARNLARSQLLANINGGKEVKKENFTDWNHAGGNVVYGLTVRRTNEYNLYSKGEYGSP